MLHEDLFKGLLFLISGSAPVMHSSDDIQKIEIRTGEIRDKSEKDESKYINISSIPVGK